MRLNKQKLKKMIREQLESTIREAGDFNPQYRADQMIKGRGRVLMAVKDPDSYQNELHDDDGNPYTDPTLQKIHSALMNADTVANRLRTGDNEEAKRIGDFSAKMFQEAEALIRSDLKPSDKGGLKYMTSMVEGAAAHMFMTRLMSVIESL